MNHRKSLGTWVFEVQFPWFTYKDRNYQNMNRRICIMNKKNRKWKLFKKVEKSFILRLFNCITLKSSQLQKLPFSAIVSTFYGHDQMRISSLKVNKWKLGGKKKKWRCYRTSHWLHCTAPVLNANAV